ncbi:MAG: Cna B-type domain-containing protein [Firmicutes bacterium]|nr:Cna B-type domain-containing protein [Bacillota bacterium]
MKKVTEKRAKTMRKNAISWRVLSLMLCALMVFGNFGSVGSLVYAEDTTQVTDENPAPVDETANEANKANEANETTNTGGGSSEGADAEAPREEEAEDPVSYSSGSLTSKAKDYEIKVTYDEAAKVPDGSSLKVEEISDEDKYNEYVENAAAKVFENEDTDAATLPYARFFDITILSPSGDVVAPASPVSVQIDLKDNALKTEDVTFSAVHFTEEEKNSTTEIVSTDIVEVTTDNVVAFDADTFSVYGVVYYYTVDFYYTDNEGAQSEYHMNGGSEMMLSELFEKLGINKAASDVTSVDFTDTSLVRFTKSGSDWIIKSLKPFTTSEMLTITFNDGSEINILTKDAVNGTVGGCTWTLTDDGTLTISGTGTLPNTGGIGNPPSQATMESKWPWYKDYRTEVKKVVVEEGVKAPKDMRGMFHGLTNLETADLTGMDAADLEACHDMFSECESLTEITFPSMFAPVQTWRMCKNCSSLTTINFGTADKPYNPTDIRDIRDNAFRQFETDSAPAFSGCDNLTTLNMPGAELQVTKHANQIANMTKAFDKANTKDKTINMPNAVIYGGTISDGATPLTTMFKLNTLAELNLQGATLDMPNLRQMLHSDTGGDTSACPKLKTVDMTGAQFPYDGTSAFKMFHNMSSLETVKLSDAEFHEYCTNYQQMFDKCAGLKRVEMGGDMNVEGATNMQNVFRGCSSLEYLDISGFGVLPNITNMNGFLGADGKNCTALKTLIIDNLDNSAIQPRRGSAHDHSSDGRMMFTWGDPSSTLPNLQTVSAKNSKVWFVKDNNVGLPSAVAFNAGNESNMYYLSQKEMSFVSDVGTTVTIDSKRDWIDLWTDHEGQSSGSSTIPDADKNINYNGGNGHLNTNGAGFLAPGVYTITDTAWEEPTLNLQKTFYRISNINDSTPTAEISADEDRIEIKGNIIQTKTYTKGDWDGSGVFEAVGNDRIIQSGNGKPVATITYPDAAEDIYGKKHDVIVKINSITFKDVDRIKESENVRHDPNTYVTDSYYRPVIRFKKGDLTFINEAYDGGEKIITDGSGTFIDFDVEIKDALQDTSVLFYMEDLDHPARQVFKPGIDPEDGVRDWHFGELPFHVDGEGYGVTYGHGSEGMILGNGNDLNTVELAGHTGLEILDGNEIVPTGSDPSTPWSAFTVRAAATGANYTWTSGVACETQLLRQTDPPSGINDVYVMPELLKRVSGYVPTGIYFTEYFHFNMEDAASDVPSVNSDILDRIGYNRTLYGTLSNSQGDEPSLGKRRTNEGEYIYFGHIKLNPPKTAPYKAAYVYKITEENGSDTEDIIKYDKDTTYYMQIIVSSPLNDSSLLGGTKAEIFIGEKYQNSGNIFWDTEHYVTVWARDMQPAYITTQVDGKKYTVYEDNSGNEFYKKDGKCYRVQDGTEITPAPETAEPIQKTVDVNVAYPIYELNGTRFYRKDGKCWYETNNTEEFTPGSLSGMVDTGTTTNISETFYIYQDANGKEFYRQGGKFWSADSSAELSRTESTDSSDNKTVNYKWKDYTVFVDHNGVEYFKADDNKYYTPLGKQLITARPGDVDPLPSDEIVTEVKMADGKEVQVDVHGKEYIQKDNKYYDANNPSTELKVGLTDKQDGLFNPNPSTDRKVYIEKKTTNNHIIKKDVNGVQYYEDSGKYYDANSLAVISKKQDGDVDPRNTDKPVKVALTAPVPLRENRTGNGNIIRETKDNPAIRYYIEKDIYYSEIGVTLDPASSGFYPKVDDSQVTTTVDVLTDPNTNKQFYRIEDKYYLYNPGASDDGSPYVMGATTVDTSDIPQVGTFHNVIKTSEISITKKTNGVASGGTDKKSGTFNYTVTFSGGFEPKNVVFNPSEGGTVTKASDWSETNNTWTFALHEGQTLTIREVPFQTTYTITEEPPTKGWEFVNATKWDESSNKQVDANSNTVSGVIKVEKYLRTDDGNGGVTITSNSEYKGQYDHTFTNRLTELLVSKIVEDGPTDEPFTFTAEVSISGLASGEKFTCGYMDSDNKLGVNKHKFFERTADSDETKEDKVSFTFTLKHDEDISIVVPLNAKVKITETKNNKFKNTKNQVDSEIAKNKLDTDEIAIDRDLKKVTFTNTAEAELEITKTWNDSKYSESPAKDIGNANEYKRQDSITVNIKGEYTVTEKVDGVDKEVTNEVALTNAQKKAILTKTTSDGTDIWKTTVTGLPVYKEGQKVKYTVTEVPIDGFTSEPVTAEASFDSKAEKWIAKAVVTNTPVKVDKFNTITLHIKKTDSVFGGGLSGAQFTIKDADNKVVGTTASTGNAGETHFDFTAPGVYTVSETKVPDGYVKHNDFKIQVDQKLKSITLVDGGTNASNNKVWQWLYDLLFGKKGEAESQTDIDITETETSGTKTYSVTVPNDPIKAKITVTKVWNDANDQDGLRKKAADASKLPKVKLQVTEKGAPTDADWQDVSGVTGITAKDISVPVDGGVVKETAANNYTWNNLPAYKNGVLLRYRVVEEGKIDGYKDPSYQAQDESYERYGFALVEPGTTTAKDRTLTITNEYTPKVAKLNTIKIWVDGNNQDGTRTEFIRVNLTSNAEKPAGAGDAWKKEWNVDLTNVSLTSPDNVAAGQWTGKEPLPVYQNQGTPIEYTLKEIILANGTLKNYTQIYEGMSGDASVKVTGNDIKFTLEKAQNGIYTVKITNKYEPKKANIKVTKEWKDGNDHAGLRAKAGDNMPKVYLEWTTKPADGVWRPISELDLVTGVSDVSVPKNGGIAEGTAGSGVTWKDMPVYKDGDTIYYRVRENNQIEGYEASYSSTYSSSHDYFALVHAAGGTHVVQDGEVKVINRYSAPYTLPKGYMNIQKTLTGRDWKSSDEFSFGLFSLGSAPMPDDVTDTQGVMHEDISIKIDDDTKLPDETETYTDKQGFGAITYTADKLYKNPDGSLKPTTFVYAIRELTAAETGKPRITGITYSGARYRAYVTIGPDDETNALKLIDFHYVDMTTGQKLDKGKIPEFINKYDPNETTYLMVAEKQFEHYGSDNDLEDGKYEFVLKPIGKLADHAPMPEGSTGIGASRTYTQKNSGHRIVFGDDLDGLDGLVFNYTALREDLERVYEAEDKDIDEAFEEGIHFEYEIYEKIPEGFTNAGDGTYNKVTETADEHYMEVYDGIHHTRMITVKVVTNDNGTPDDATDDFHELEVTASSDDHTGDFYYTSGANENGTGRTTLTDHDVYKHAHGTGGIPIFHNELIPLRNLEITKEWEDGEFYSDGYTFEDQADGYTRPNIAVTVVGTGKDRNDETIEVYRRVVTISGDQEGTHQWKTVQLTDLPEYVGESVPGLHTHDIKNNEVSYTVTESVPKGYKITNGTGDWDTSNDKLWKVTLKNEPLVDQKYNPITIDIKKVDHNTKNGLAGATFKVTKADDSEYSKVTEATGADGTVEFTFDTPGSYTIKEETVPKGYKKSDEEYKVVWEPEFKSAALDNESDKWMRTYTLEFNDVESTELQGDAETGYTLTVENTAISALLTITKTWDDGNNRDGKRVETRAHLQRKLGEDGTWEDMHRPNSSELWAPVRTDYENNHGQVNTGELYAYVDGKVAYYRVVENPLPGYTTTYDAADGVYASEGKGVSLLDESDETGMTAVDRTLDIKNSYTPETVYIKVTKAWDDADFEGIEDYARQDIKIKVTAKAGSTELKASDLGLTDEDLVKTISADAEGEDLTVVFEDLPRRYNPNPTIDDSHMDITYSVEEEVPSIWTKSGGTLTEVKNSETDEVEGYEATFTNTPVDGEEKEVTRTITYTYIDENGNTAVASKEQKLTLRRMPKAVDPETGKVTEWYDWKVEEDEFKDGFPEVKSPEYDAADSSTSSIKGWKAIKASTPKMSLEDIIKGVEEGTSEFEENIPYETTPATDTGETKDVLYESVGEVKDQSWTPSKDFMDEIEGVVVPDGKGTPNEVEEFVLVDESGKEVPSITTDEGTYTIDKETGKVTFTPNEGFTGKASTVTVRAKDKVGKATGKYPEAKYTPEVVDNLETKTVTRTITYTYIDENGNTAVASKQQKMTLKRIGKEINLETGEVTEWGDWEVEEDEFKDGFPEVESPEYDAADSSTSGIKGWKATKASTPKMSLEDIIKSIEEGTTEIKEIVPYATTPATETGETKDVLYEPDGDIKDQAWAPSKDFLDEVEDVVVPDGKGTPNEVEEFVLVDESGKEVPSITTDEGTYTIDKGTGKVTFTPKEGFTGKGTTVTVRAKDKVGAVTGKYPEAKYTPEVVNNRKSTTATRRITYTYLTPDGEEVTNAEVQSLDFDKYGVLDPENPDADDNGLVWIGSWIPRTGDTFPAVESPVVDEWIADRILVPAFKVLDPEGTTFEVHVVYQTAKEPSVDPTPEPKPTPKDDPTPRTGDESNAALWIGILAAAVCLVAILFFIKKRNKDDDNSGKQNS